MFPRWLYKRWKAVGIFIVVFVLLWLVYFSAKKQDTPTLQISIKNALLESVRAESPIAAIPLLQPLHRGGPGVRTMVGPQQLQTVGHDDNNAKEIIDTSIEHHQVGMSDDHKPDDNAADEVQSAQLPESLSKNDSINVNHIFFLMNATKLKQVTEAPAESFHQLTENQKQDPGQEHDSYINWRQLTSSEIRNLSILGRRLFMNEQIGHEQEKSFIIHLWKSKKYIQNRLLKANSKKPFDPFADCSVSNCKITFDDNEVTAADVVLFHLHRLDGPPTTVPRGPGQLWVWLSDEAPNNIFMAARDKELSHYNSYFNWSMTYRMDADVPVPYGRTIRLSNDQHIEKEIDMFNKKKKGIAILGSNCMGKNLRFKYIKELQKHIPVDIYGRCGSLKCPGHFYTDCSSLDDYKFYLAFENDNCDDYITEKAWWNALQKGAVPVVLGATAASYRKLLPPGSFILAEDFTDPHHLASHLRFLLTSPDAYNQYHSWRRQYRILNEHGYFQSSVYHMCRLCEALNYNQHVGSADLETFFNPKQHCYPPRWSPTS